MGKLEKLRRKLLARPVEMDFADVRLLLEADDWVLNRVTGSHHHFTKAGERTMTVSVHNGKVRQSAVNDIADRISQTER